MITVLVNNQNCLLEKNSSLDSALIKNGITGQRGIAVAVNNSVIPKAEWKNRILLENDKITVIKATQGG